MTKFFLLSLFIATAAALTIGFCTEPPFSEIYWVLAPYLLVIPGFMLDQHISHTNYLAGRPVGCVYEMPETNITTKMATSASKTLQLTDSDMDYMGFVNLSQAVRLQNKLDTEGSLNWAVLRDCTSEFRITLKPGQVITYQAKTRGKAMYWFRKNIECAGKKKWLKTRLKPINESALIIKRKW